MPNRVHDAFAPLLGRPAWQVRKGHGSFLTMEFGDPHLEVRAPSPAAMESSEAVRKLAAKRIVTVRGAWHLWIYCCHWKITREGILEAEDESTDHAIMHAAAFLDGQILDSVAVQSASATVFRFDLGGTLSTHPYAEGGEDEQWLLYEPTGTVLSVRGDGKCFRGPGDTPPEDERWTSPTDAV